MRPTFPMLAAALLSVSLSAGAQNPAQDDLPPRPKTAPNQPEPLPTVDEIQKLLDTGDALAALKRLNRLLALRGKAAEAFDRYELLTLKGDAHLRLKANDAAAMAFRQAAAATEDAHHQSVARATELLIRRSKNLVYTPKKVAKGQAADPIDIVAAEPRRKALAALFVDEVTPLLPKIEAAKGAPSVVPMIKAMAAAREMEFLERAANGSADQMGAIVHELGEQGKTMLGKVLEKATKRVDRITTLSNEVEHIRQVIPTNTGGYRSIVIPKRRGIKKDDVIDLKGVIDALDEIVAQANALAEARGAGEEDIEELADGAYDLKLHVQRMLRVHDVEYAGRREKRGV